MRIVVIPAVPNTPLRHRAAELGLALGARHRVRILVGERQPQGLRAAGKLLWHLRQALTISTRPLAPGVTAVRLPALPRWPRLSRVYQGTALALAAPLWRLDAVLTEGTGELRAPRGRHVRIVYDLPDDHMAGFERAGKPEAAAAIRDFIRSEMARAVAVTASSRVLQGVVRREFGREAVLAPNGVETKAYRSVPSGVVDALRVRLGIGEGPVLGFTGGLDEWVDAPLAVATLEEVRVAHPDAQLLVVGDGARAKEFGVAGAVVTGFVPPADVPAYVALFDVGLVPFERSALTDAMLPIKVFDYAAGRKPVVTTPLAAYDGEDLPFLTVAAAEPRGFAAAVRAALVRGWDASWDASVDRYDWGMIVRPIEGLLAPGPPDRGKPAPLGREGG